MRRVLKPGGLFLNHEITDNEKGKNRTLGTEFINRYVFPDGELDSVSNMQSVMEQTGFEICWRLYMTASALQFEHGAIGVYQILAANKQDGLVGLPLTRRDIYR